jgi:putative salt-induced outer membrane protein YdiY
MLGSFGLNHRKNMLITPILPLLLIADLGVGAGATTPSVSSEPVALQEPAAETKWKGKADFGLTYLSGNNESTTAAFSAELAYNEDVYQWLFTANYAGVRTTDPVTNDASTTSRLYATGGQYNRFMDEEKNLYFYGKAAARKDIPVGLELRWDAGIGGGYTWYFADDKKTLFSLEGGPSFLHEENVGAAEKVDAAAARAAARYEQPLWEEWLLNASGEVFVSLDDTEDRTFVGELNLNWNMSQDWYLSAKAAVAWDNTPAPGFESTDRRFVLAVGHTF